MVQNAMGLQGFYPDVQDQAALYLIQRRQALPLADRGELSPDLAARLAPEWASFPTLAGNSFYGQPVKRYDELKRFYDDNLSQLRQTESESIQQWEDVAIRQVAIRQVPVCNDQSLSCKLESVTEAGNGNQR
jgi:lysozyme